MTRAEVRELATKCRIVANECRGDDDGVAEILNKCAEALSAPAWFSAHELRLAADAMDALNVSTADGATLRARLDEFWRIGPFVKDANGFAFYLSNLPNGGVQ